MTQSEVDILLYKFRPNCSGNCLIELATGASFSGTPPTDGHIRVPTSYKITMQPKPGPHAVKFTIKTPTDSQESHERYCLVGIYFINDKLSESGPNVGQDLFTRFECDIASNPPSLTLHVDRDAAKRGEEYEFMLLVQRLRDGALGIIDPEWENE